MASITQKK
jgi:hypothetical protein